MTKKQKERAKTGLGLTAAIFLSAAIGGLIVGGTTLGTRLYGRLTNQDILVWKEVGTVTEKAFFAGAEEVEGDTHIAHEYTFKNGTVLTYHEDGELEAREEWSKTVPVFKIDASAVSYVFEGELKYYINGIEIVDEAALVTAIKNGKDNDKIVIKALVNANENVSKAYVAPATEDDTEEASVEASE